MAKIQEIKINNFSGGISDSPRENTGSKFVISKHFDIFADPQKLTPYRDLALDTNDGATSTGMKQYLIKDFVYSSTDSKLYGLGQVVATGFTKIFYKGNATTGNWTIPASSEGNGAVQNGCLVEYKDYLWGFQGSNQVFKWGLLSGTPSITNSVNTVGTITSVAQGIIGKDDNLYLPYNNKLARVVAAGTVSDAVLTLPTDLKITSLTRYGNYLAIGCAPISVYNGKSVTFFWNYTSTDPQETIDWGPGELRILESIDGMLVSVTDNYLNNATGAGRGSMIIKTYNGGTPQVVKEVFTQALTGKSIPISKVVQNNRVFWAAKIMTNAAGTEYNEGLWSFGRKNVAYPYALALDVIDENIDTDGIQAFGSAANFFFITHSGDGSIDKTSATATYTFTSIYETQIYNSGSTNTDKKLLQFSVETEPLTSGQSVTLKYKVDADTSWTTFGTHSTVGVSARDFFGIESSGLPFPTHAEIKFRIESTGGAAVTGYALKTQTLTGSITL